MCSSCPCVAFIMEQNFAATAKQCAASGCQSAALGFHTLICQMEWNMLQRLDRFLLLHPVCRRGACPTPTAPAAQGGAASPPVRQHSAAAGLPSASLRIQAAVGSGRAWRSACPGRNTAAPCSAVAVHAAAGDTPGSAATPDNYGKAAGGMLYGGSCTVAAA